MFPKRVIHSGENKGIRVVFYMIDKRVVVFERVKCNTRERSVYGKKNRIEIESVDAEAADQHKNIHFPGLIKRFFDRRHVLAFSYNPPFTKMVLSEKRINYFLLNVIFISITGVETAKKRSILCAGDLTRIAR